MPLEALGEDHPLLKYIQKEEAGIVVCSSLVTDPLARSPRSGNLQGVRRQGADRDRLPHPSDRLKDGCRLPTVRQGPRYAVLEALHH